MTIRGNSNNIRTLVFHIYIYIPPVQGVGVHLRYSGLRVCGGFSSLGALGNTGRLSGHYAGVYLEGHADLVGRLIIRTARVTIWMMGAINLLT